MKNRQVVLSPKTHSLSGPLTRCRRIAVPSSADERRHVLGA